MRVGVVFRALVFACGFLGSFGVGIASAAFELTSQSHAIDLERRETTFLLEFNQRPDFHRTVTIAPGGVELEANAFQVFYGSNLTGPDVLGEDVVVLRGPEIRFEGELPVRDTLGSDDDPRAGGFGPIRGTVPLTLQDESVSFTVPWKLLGETDQEYRFIVETYDRGELTSSVSVMVPLPAAGWPALVTLGGTLAMGSIRKHLRRRN